tara:strand:- start:7949 stop:8251 length:303 start_codon:yes stop_codon:yes gene_type:complete
MSGKYEMDNNSALFFTVTAIVMGISIMFTASALSPDTCVSEKVSVAKLSTALETRKFDVPYGKCIEFPASEQRVCKSLSGKFSVDDFEQDGMVSAPEIIQ